MNTQSKALALGVILSGALLTGCGAPMNMADQLAEIKETADQAMHMAKTAEYNATQAHLLATTADELARKAVSCCDANSHRMNKDMHGMHKK